MNAHRFLDRLAPAAGTGLRRARGLIVATALAASGLPATALDLQWSGFGSLGVASSNRDYTWQRYITRDPSVERDSLLAGQLDAAFNPEWSATVQLRLAPALRQDNAWSAKVAWAFVGWRPNNDWLVRLGRFRVPLFLYSESLDINHAHDMLRLPNDTYTLNPTSDFDGGFVSRSWQAGNYELTADLYAGRTDTSYRRWAKDGLPPVQAPGPVYVDAKVQSSGLVMTLRDESLTVRIGGHHVGIRAGQALPVRYPRVELGNGLGYWQVDAAMPGPGVPTADRVRVLLGTAGVDWSLPHGWRVIAEAARFKQLDTELGLDAKTGYVNVSRRVGEVTPYITVSRALSGAAHRRWVQRLRGSDLPVFVPGAAFVNAAQHLAADAQVVYDQSTVALGASWALTPNLKLKGEWARTRIGSMSSTANPGPGTAWPTETHVDVRSLVLSFSF